VWAFIDAVANLVDTVVSFRLVGDSAIASRAGACDRPRS
jgi:hypothetical protein